MLFNSINFLIFFPIVCMGYFIIPKGKRYIWLLLASYYFYMSWNAQYALLLFASTFVTYLSSVLMNSFEGREDWDAKRKKKRKKLCVAGSVVINLGMLFFFKYYNFAADTVAAFLGRFHITMRPPVFDVLLPVGISFYIFQALGYTIDVYRGGKVERNFLRYALFVSFFPQLVAGPIERSENLLKQLREEHDFSFDRMKEGLLLMLWGYFMKLAIADRIAIFVDAVYGDLDTYGGWYVILASILFAFQIYCDFAGYSTIAAGAAKVMGFQLMENFNCPYLSRSVGEFWRRWHISLSSWFRDYLYIPLGGNRKGYVRKQMNLMVVFLTSGLWHGANWTYLIWGGINGIFQVLGSLYQGIRDWVVEKCHIDRNVFSHKLYKTLVTFIMIDFSWIFFRAATLGDAWKAIKSIFTIHNPWILFDGSLYKLGLNQKNYQLMWLMIAVLIFADILKYRGIVIREWLQKQGLWFRWVVYLTAVMSVLVFGIYGYGYDAGNFIYFQF